MTISVNFEQGNSTPRIVRITTSSTLAQVTAAGWYKNVAPNQLLPSDQVEIAYAQGTANAATSIFDVAIAAGIVTLSLGESNVILPVVAGHFANFSGTSGAIRDAGYLPSDAAKTKVAMVNAATVVGNLAKFSDISGTIADQGIAFKSVAGAAAAGGAAAQSFTDAFCTSGSCVVGNWNTQANAASVLKIVPGNGSFIVTSSADAGVGTFNYIITK